HHFDPSHPHSSYPPTRPPPPSPPFPYTTLFRSSPKPHRTLVCGGTRPRPPRNESRASTGAMRCVLESAVREIGGPSFHYHRTARSEEHTSELQSLAYLVCRLLLEKKN